MAAEAEADRDARAKVVAATGELKASQALKEAADVITESPAALQLRYLQTLCTVAAEKNSTIIFPIPGLCWPCLTLSYKCKEGLENAGFGSIASFVTFVTLAQSHQFNAFATSISLRLPCSQMQGLTKLLSSDIYSFYQKIFLSSLTVPKKACSPVPAQFNFTNIFSLPGSLTQDDVFSTHVLKRSFRV
eukprot:sb/3471227/